MFSFHNLEMKYGAAAAYSFLIEMERAARISSSGLADLDPELRLSHAIKAQDSLIQLQQAA